VTPIRLLLADDHPIVRAGLRHFVIEQADMVVVGEATSQLLRRLTRINDRLRLCG
jgi:DNA-binding NarL/FixJ family response regulator